MASWFGFDVQPGRLPKVCSLPGDDLASLDETVLTRFRADLDSERTEHVASTRLQLNAIRQIMSHLRPDRPGSKGMLT